jgi:CubicO group peptidase (beta-lactamase class C family)
MSDYRIRAFSLAVPPFKNIVLFGLAMILLISCAPRTQTVATTLPQDPLTEPKSLAGIDPRGSWTDFRGEVREYSRTQGALQKIMEENGVAGLSVYLIQRAPSRVKGAETQFINFGIEDPNTKKPVDDTTVFRAERMGHPVLAYLVFKLVTDGQFDIDQPLYQYLSKDLPDFPNYADLKGDSRFKRLTARLILSHQSGLSNSRDANPDHRLTFEASPGKGFAYSEEGYLLLQFVLEQKFGRNINELAKSIVFDPLSLNRMSFVREPRFEGHFATADGSIDDSKHLKTDISKTFYTSAKDYVRFIWLVMVGFGGLDFLACRPFFQREVDIRSATILEKPRPGNHLIIPNGLGWSCGWGKYEKGYIYRRYPNIITFMGHREQGIECYAASFTTAGGTSTAISIFVVGKTRRSITSEVLRAMVGELDPPLDWLGFDSEANI